MISSARLIAKTLTFAIGKTSFLRLKVPIIKDIIIYYNADKRVG